jgi:hypothetical protein
MSTILLFLSVALDKEMDSRCVKRYKKLPSARLLYALNYRLHPGCKLPHCATSAVQMAPLSNGFAMKLGFSLWPRDSALGGQQITDTRRSVLK